MARDTLSLLSLPSLLALLFISLLHLSPAAAVDLAPPVPQRLHHRQSFEGGWAIGLPGTTCPSDVPTVCTSSNIANPACCPSGTTCFGLSSLYCCPTDTDCGSVVEEFPRCANTSWTLYSLKTSGYFCCPPGQFGVLPVQNYGGLCQLDGVNLPASRIATRVSSQEVTQGGNVPATTSTGRTIQTFTSLSTGTDGSVSKITQLSTGQVTFTNPGSGPTSPASGQNGNGENMSSSSSSSSLGAGAIAGIVIGALAVLALFILAFLLYRYLANKNKHSNTAPGFFPQEQAPQYSAVPRQDFNGGSNPEMQNYPIVVKSPASNAPVLHTGAAPTPGTVSPMHGGEYGDRPVEVPAPPQQWESRAEIGSSR